MILSDIVEKYFQIPQDYSFFVFGTHGTGLQSLLFFLSKLKKNNKNIYPLPLHWTNQKIVPNLTSLLWKEKILGTLPKSAWGITFEGSPKNLSWVGKNIKNKALALILVRDPMEALISHINYYIGRDIFVHDQFLGFDPYCREILFSNTQLDRTCGFCKNIAPLNKNITSKLYIDTQDIIGEKTNQTMQLISDFLDFDCPNSYSFNIKVNSQFERPFPFVLVLDDYKYYLSCFPNRYKNELFPKYETKKLNYIDEFYQSSYFPEKKFYIFAEDKILDRHKPKIYEWADLTLQCHKFKMDKYNQNKIDKDVLFDFLTRNSVFCQKLKIYLKDQVECIKDDSRAIIDTWKNYNEFLTI